MEEELRNNFNLLESTFNGGNLQFASFYGQVCCKDDSPPLPLSLSPSHAHTHSSLFGATFCYYIHAAVSVEATGHEKLCCRTLCQQP